MLNVTPLCTKILGLVVLLHFTYNSKVLAQIAKDADEPELVDPKPRDYSSWEQIKYKNGSGFISENIHLDRSSAPLLHTVKDKWYKKAWKGERVHTQLVIYTKKNLRDVHLEVSDLRSSKKTLIKQNHVKANFVRYVMTDDISDLKQGCAFTAKLDSSLRADLIDSKSTYNISDSTSRPIWLSVDIPRDAAAGTYHGHITIVSPDYKADHPFTIEVLNHELPTPKDWKFHLDLWQNPYSDARIHGVELWSDKHFELMRPNYERLADAGQKVITATLINDPWSAQTHDIYGGMIKWIKKKDGTWTYDFSVFDKWVSYMMALGIDKQINAYGMIPWTLAFQYYDESSASMQVFEAKPDSEAYAIYWGNMLKEFAKHLKNRNLFSITQIAMDERPEKDMLAAIKIIKDADSNYAISMAGNYHVELQQDLSDYSVASTQRISKEVMAERKQKGLVTTFYTSCTEIYPNTYTSSDYAELTWLPWHALYNGYDGYLRWDYNNWNKSPATDSRYATFPAGDCFFVYPGDRSSIRFERLREGIQDFEKVNILKEQMIKSNNLQGFKKLEEIIQLFAIEKLDGKNAHIFVEEAKSLLNNL